jgi:membrane protein YdbS with pleckstrin-like domain
VSAARSFCENCGAPTDAGDRFCPSCGHRLKTPEPSLQTATAHASSPVIPYSTTEATTDTEQPTMALRPRFIGWTTIVSVIPIQLFMTVWAGGFCGGFSSFAMKPLQRLTGVSWPMQYQFIFFGLLAFFGIPFLTYFSKWRQYKKMEYRFYPDRLEYYVGFIQIEQKTILYRNIQEIDLKKGPFQRQYGLGTIVITTPGMVMQGNRTSGIRLSDIENPDDVYQYLKELVRREQQNR